MTDHIPDTGKMVSARDALATALVRHIEGDSVTRDLITDAEWSGYQSDADYALELLSAAGWVVVPREPTEAMLQDGLRAAQKARHTGISGQTVGAVVRASAFREAAAYRAMIAAVQEGGR